LLSFWTKEDNPVGFSDRLLSYDILIGESPQSMQKIGTGVFQKILTKKSLTITETKRSLSTETGREERCNLYFVYFFQMFQM